MPHLKIKDRRIPIPEDTVAFLESRLGSRDLAAAALRGAMDPGYYRQMMAAIRSGGMPREALDLAEQLSKIRRRNDGVSL